MTRSSTASLLSRVAAGVVLLLAAGALPWLSQRDPAASILRARYAELEATPEALAQVRDELGLDAGPLAMSLRWWSGVLRGDLGSSWVSGAAIGPGIWGPAGVSLTLTVFAVVVALAVCALIVIPVCRRVLHDRAPRGAGPAGVALTAIPEFLLAGMLLVVVGVQLRWLPPYGWSGPLYAILPALSLGLPAGGLLGRLLGDAIAGASSERWVSVWRLSGARPQVILRGVLRRASAAVVDQLGLVIIGIFGGAVAVEQIFAIPGLGRYLLGAANSQDLPALQAGVLIMACAAVLVGALFGLVRLALWGGSLPRGALTAPPEVVRDDAGARRTLSVALVALGLILAFGLPRDPFGIAYARLEAPSLAAPFGADAVGRDVLARVAHGAITTLLPAFGIALAAVAVGLLVSFIGSWGTGPIEVANATPPIVAGVVVAALTGPSVGGAVIAVLWVSWPPLAAHAAALRQEAHAMTHIRWLPLAGAGRVEIELRHVVPSILPPLIRHGMLRLPGIALSLAALGFLGLGQQPPEPEWGLLLSEGIDYVERAPWTTAFPAIALILVSVIAVAAAGLGATRKRSRQRRGWRSEIEAQSSAP